MATNTIVSEIDTQRDAPNFSLWDGLTRMLQPAASLRVTVVLFALSIFLILAGTFAQVEKDIWEVIGLYFRVWWAWVPAQVFLPPSFYEAGVPPKLPEWLGIVFPGGKTLGLLLAVNLLTAHIVRFKVVASGERLLAGIAAIAVGCFVTWLVIASGGNSKGIQAEPWLPYKTQWIGYQGFLAFAILTSAVVLISLCREPLSSSGIKRARQIFLRGVLVSFGLGLAALLGWILWKGQSIRPSDSSLRILWQLTQGSVASLALLLGCWTVFGKRAGIVLLHGGIGLMMFYELHVALTAVETQLHLGEGERSNYVQDIRTFELAVVDTTDAKEDRVVAIPKSILLGRKSIDSPDLPFKIEIRDYVKNARLRSVDKSDQNLATAGVGLTAFPEPTPPSTGTDSDGRIDEPAAYATLTSKSDGKTLGTYLVSMRLTMTENADSLTVGDHRYRLELRPKRYYKPYVFELKDVRKEDYIGTSTPRFYASTVHIVDKSRNVDEEKTIWMNNPLRFADETFYQSNFSQEAGTGYERTTLSVVANSGWMMPYVGCALVGIGMLVHFLSLLVQFLTKGDTAKLSTEDSKRVVNLAEKLGMKTSSKSGSAANLPSAARSSDRMAVLFATVIFLLAASYVGRIAQPPKPQLLSFDFYRFGQIPVISEGRAKPIDSAASTALLEISGRTTLFLRDEYDKLTFTQQMFGAKKATWKLPAVQWLLDDVTDAKASRDRQIFRVENLEVQETIGVKKREGMRYTPTEIWTNFGALQEQIDLASNEAEKDAKHLSTYKKKILELSKKLSTYMNLKAAFSLQNRIGGETKEEIFNSLIETKRRAESLDERGHPVYAIPPRSENDRWHTLSRAWIDDFVNQIQKKEARNQAVALWDDIFNAYADNDPSKFNASVDQLLKMFDTDAPQIDNNPPKALKSWIIRLEAYFNHVQPFTHACVLYVMAFILGAIGWLVWPRGFNRAAFALLLVTYSLHTAALVGRLIISGRPPVTNLYSSAVFIGWGCVLLGMLFELVYRIGIGNLVAAVAGYATLLIADGLAADGDTFTVLQAVLDTQFWLATHVTTITLGYATTYLAGLFGVAYILRGVCTPSLTIQEGRDIQRMIYGTLCFSIFFSFIGTVLGGLWADDSWGRFWGWDPKENAALIIVLWNALVLHARWGGMVKERGFAALAVAGNIFVSWSWWGVNALGAGLHSYGFKQGTMQILAMFIMVNLIIISAGMLPKTYWWSFRRQSAQNLD